MEEELGTPPQADRLKRVKALRRNKDVFFIRVPLRAFIKRRLRIKLLHSISSKKKRGA
jgi:hypothetical protein